MTELCSSTLAATLAVSPFLLFYFERVPVLSIITNIFVLPAIPLLMVLIPILFFSSFIHPILAWFVAFILNSILQYELFVIYLAQSIPVSLVISDALARTLLFLLYLFIAGVLVFLHFQKILRHDVYP
jgi:competence protein ComEC